MANNSVEAPQYVLPRDAPEDERLNFQHMLLCKTFGGLYRAPLDRSKVQHVLDIGCGTGKWAVDYAIKNPHAEVIGMDMSSSPEWADAPANCKLILANAEDESVWAGFDKPFDFIHGRFIVVGMRDWPLLFERSFKHLTPGGWFEIQDLLFPTACVDKPKGVDSKFLAWGDLMYSGMKKFGLVPSIITEFPEMMPQAGFSAPKVDQFKLYSGPWADDQEQKGLGHLGNKNFHLGFKGFSTTLMKQGHGFTDEQLVEQENEVMKEIDAGTFKTYVPVQVVYAQKST